MPDAPLSQGIVVGATIDRVELEITYRRMIINVAGSWDFYAGHHDRDYARQQGHPDVFANTSLFLSFADRVITDWSGPGTRIARRKLTMRLPVHPGDTIYGEGEVTRVRDGRVDVQLTIGCDRGDCAYVEATIEL